MVLVNATMPRWAPSGYVKGKKMAEQCARDFVAYDPANAAAPAAEPTSPPQATAAAPAAAAATLRGAVVLKPGAIYGTRHTPGGTPIPLAPLLAPVAWGLKLLPGPAALLTRAAPALFEGLVVPPVCVDALAAMVVRGATAPEFAGKITVLDAFELTK